MIRPAQLAALALLCCSLIACDSDSRSGSTPTTPPPPPPPPATIAGEWSGTETVESVRPNDLCVSVAYLESRRGVAVPVTATFEVNGNQLTITYHHTFGDYTASGTVDGTSFSATLDAVTPAEHQLQCRVPGTGQRRTRVVSLASGTISGTANANFTSITAQVTLRENTRGLTGANTDPVTTEAALALTKP